MTTAEAMIYAASYAMACRYGQDPTLAALGAVESFRNEPVNKGLYSKKPKSRARRMLAEFRAFNEKRDEHGE